MHVLDFLMYIVFLYIIIKLLGDEYTQELGGIVGIIVIILYTIIYLILFVWVDYNWIDIFKSINFNFKL